MDEAPAIHSTPWPTILTSNVKAGEDLAKYKLSNSHWSPDEFTVYQSFGIEEGHNHDLPGCQCAPGLLWS